MMSVLESMILILWTSLQHFGNVLIVKFSQSDLFSQIAQYSWL